MEVNGYIPFSPGVYLVTGSVYKRLNSEIIPLFLLVVLSGIITDDNFGFRKTEGECNIERGFQFLCS